MGVRRRKMKMTIGGTNSKGERSEGDKYQKRFYFFSMGYSNNCYNRMMFLGAKKLP
jgi:hypothetical protein